MINKNHTEILAQTKMQSLHGELRRLMTSFEEVQEQVLLDILRYSKIRSLALQTDLRR